MTTQNIYNKFNDRLIHEFVASVRLANIEKEREKDNLVDLSILKNNYSHSSLTPFTKSIYESIASVDKTQFLNDIAIDQEKVDKSLIRELSDTYNLELSKSKLGFYMEDYLCDKLLCPYCSGKLLKFVKQNMPMVDMICENAEDHVKSGICCLWQVKTTVASFDYFNRNDQLITISNNIYSQIVIEPSKEYKHLQIGFICIYLDELADEYRYRINYKNSFMLKPFVEGFKCYSRVLNDKRKISITWDSKCIKEPIDLPYIGYSINTNEVYFMNDKLKNPLDRSIGNLSNILNQVEY